MSFLDNIKMGPKLIGAFLLVACLLYTSPSPRD